jgi:hypothetical protein
MLSFALLTPYQATEKRQEAILTRLVSENGYSESSTFLWKPGRVIYIRPREHLWEKRTVRQQHRLLTIR